MHEFPFSQRFWIASVVVAVAVLVAGCMDMGYRAATPPPDAGLSDSGDSGDATSDCVEGPVAATAGGTQVRFVPTNAVDLEVVIISAGDVITFTNTDAEMHTATAGAPGAIRTPEELGFQSGRLGTGGQFAWQFCVPRTVVWFCETHPAQMNGYRIIVEE